MERNESHSRGLWIFVAVVVAVMCLCAAAVTAIGLGALSGLGINLEGIRMIGEDSVTQNLQVGAAPQLTIDNFSGGVTVHAGEAGTIRVIAVKKGSPSQREKIQVRIDEKDGGVEITTSRPSTLFQGSVDLEITAPADTRLNLHTGSGGVSVQGLTGPAQVDTGSGGIDLRDVTGEIEAETGSGGIDVVGAKGVVRLSTGSGGIEYAGAPQGKCTFDTGSGGIELTLPASLNMKVDLSTGSGSVDVSYDVDGAVSARKVIGTIGTGDEGTILAHTGSGSIDLNKE